MTVRRLVMNGEPTGITIEVASSFFERLKGLMGKKGPAGMLLPMTNAIHTFFMRFSIDVFFLDAGNRVIRITRGIPAGRIALPVPGAKSVLELPSDAPESCAIAEGDRLSFIAP